jgi:hypothetical protein
MSRVTKHPDFTNPIKSISYIPDHYVNIVGSAPDTGVTEYKAGQVVAIDLATFKITAAGAGSGDGATGNAIVFSDTAVNENEGTPVTIMIHGFVDKNKLINPELLGKNTQITVIG